MPRKEIDYNKTVFYKLVCNDLNIYDCYVGSTTDFTSRKRHHKRSCTQEQSFAFNLPVYKFIREHGNWDNWSMIPIEQIALDNKLDVLKREREHIEALKSTLNRQIPTRTKHEYTITNREKKKEYDKVYLETNRVRIKERNRNYIQQHRDEKIQYAHQYYSTNKDAVLAKQRIYNSTRVVCERCGKEMRRDSVIKHNRSNKCQEISST